MEVKAKPFIKWAGGKGQLLKTLERLLPSDFDLQTNVTYIEPFVGGGAMLFHMLENHKNIRRAVINDINVDLIRCYQLIKNNPEELIARLQIIDFEYGQFVDNDYRRILFYEYRKQYNRLGIDPDERAALFLFLNRTCFNGLYRVNSTGQFNVPFGRYKNPLICNEELIMKDHELLRSVELIIREPGDYKLTAKNIGRGYNFVYFDPPYRPLLNECNFKDYSNSPFGDAQQEELKQFCDMLSNKNCKIMLSNSDSKNEDGSSYFEELYQGYDFQLIYAPRFINAFQKTRAKLNEVLIRNYNE